MTSSIIVKLISKDSVYPDLQIQSTSSNSSPSLIVGRNEQSKIKSTRCARQQGTHKYTILKDKSCYLYLWHLF